MGIQRNDPENTERRVALPYDELLSSSIESDATIGHRMGQLEATVADLVQVIGQLAGKISPVLRVTDTNPNVSEGRHPSPRREGDSPLALDLSEITQSVRDQVDLVRQISAHVDL